MLREIVTIDEELCDGCGRCVPACAEGALRIVNGKARLVADRLCDGMGACLGHCPKGAIKIEYREADAFDEAAVAAAMPYPAHRREVDSGPGDRSPAMPPVCGNDLAQQAGGCPGSRLRMLEAAPAAPGSGCGGAALSAEAPASALRHWPVQLRLLPATAPVLRGCRLLVSADCVPFAYAGFHGDLLAGRAVVIACPKLDDTRGYVEKLAQMIQVNQPRDITVAHMEVPCCNGILMAVLEARALSESDVPVHDVVISVDGRVLRRRSLSDENVEVC